MERELRVAFYTLGCKVNQYEAEQMREKFQAAGYETVDFSEAAEVYVISTCTVTAVSDKKSRQAIAAARRAGGPEAVIVAAGCYPQVAAEELRALDIDLVLGNEEKGETLRLVEKFLEKRERLAEVAEIGGVRTFRFDPVRGADERSRAHIKIEDGCDNFCSYCIIPYARGRVRSARIADVAAEFEALLEEGFLEVVLTGIEIASFGKDTGESFAELLETLEGPAARAGARIRLGSLEPRVVTQEFVRRLSGLSSLCPHFHLSLQSGSDKVLRAMNRKYDTALYREAVRRLREALPDCAITTDLITGFPGEGEMEQEETLRFVREIGFAKVHVFPYSERKGTRAVKLPEQVPMAVRRARAHVLSEVCGEVRRQFLREMVGATVTVLFETEREGAAFGHSENYTPVTVERAGPIAGQMRRVKITSAGEDMLRGELL